MNNLNYCPSQFIIHDIKPCPLHGRNHIITTNDGNRTQKCGICNWTWTHQTGSGTFIPRPSHSQFIIHDIMPCPTHGYTYICTTNDGNLTQTCEMCKWSYQHN